MSQFMPNTSTSIKKIPFRISARTARLIGRQNFPNAEGAIIELVKNSYDADASTCVVIFDNRFAKIPEKLTSQEFQDFKKTETLISEYYFLDEEQKSYIWRDKTSKMASEKEKIRLEKNLLRDFFRLQTKLYVIDSGEGMTDKIIQDFWMTIGTNNKEIDIFTKNKRIKTGAKGIGRFALDKLGDTAEVLTKPDPELYEVNIPDNAYLWQVDWNSFEGNGKILEEVEADLIDIVVPEFFSEIESVLPQQAKSYPEVTLP